MLWLYGMAVGADSAANFVPLNTADDWPMIRHPRW